MHLTIDVEERLAPAMQALNELHTTEAWDLARSALEKMRLDSGESWGEVIKLIRKSDLFHISQLCPFTSHGYSKPRGYAGDALLLDWIYGDNRINNAPIANTKSAELYRITTSCPAATAVRWRKQHLANLIDDSAMRKRNARVLSIACGHLREADESIALNNGLIHELVALDQDGESLHEVDRQYAAKGMPVVTTLAPIRDVIAGRLKLENFDLIYSAGLYDYLEDSLARKLCTTLFDALSPGGRLVLTNFLHGTRDIAYMEAMMDWFLIFRTQSEIVAFADDIPADQIARLHSYQCPTASVGYVSIRKRWIE